MALQIKRKKSVSNEHTVHTKFLVSHLGDLEEVNVFSSPCQPHLIVDSVIPVCFVVIRLAQSLVSDGSQLEMRKNDF